MDKAFCRGLSATPDGCRIRRHGYSLSSQEAKAVLLQPPQWAGYQYSSFVCHPYWHVCCSLVCCFDAAQLCHLVPYVTVLRNLQFRLAILLLVPDVTNRAANSPPSISCFPSYFAHNVVGIHIPASLIHYYYLTTILVLREGWSPVRCRA